MVGELTKYRPAGALFELNIYGLVSDAFVHTEPEPAIPGRAGQSDVQIRAFDREIYIENTVIGETQFMRRVRDHALTHGGVATWSGDPHSDAFDVVRRLAKKAHAQSAQHAPNVICVSFADDHPFDFARNWAFADLLSDKRFVANPKKPDERVYLTDFHRRIDAVFEFGRDRLIREHVNPHVTPLSRLTNDERTAIRTALTAAPLMIR